MKTVKLLIIAAFAIVLVGCGSSSSSSSKGDTPTTTTTYTSGESFTINDGEKLVSQEAGTTFDLSTDAETGETTVTVTNGTVSVE